MNRSSSVFTHSQEKSEPKSHRPIISLLFGLLRLSFSFFIPDRPRSFKASFADLPEKNVAGDLHSGLYHVSQNFLAHFFGTRCDKLYDVTLEQSADRLSQSASALVALTDEHGYAVAALVSIIFLCICLVASQQYVFPIIFDNQMTIAGAVAHIYTSRYGWTLRRNSL